MLTSYFLNISLSSRDCKWSCSFGTIEGLLEKLNYSSLVGQHTFTGRQSPHVTPSISDEAGVSYWVVKRISNDLQHCFSLACNLLSQFIGIKEMKSDWNIASMMHLMSEVRKHIINSVKWKFATIANTWKRKLWEWIIGTFCACCNYCKHWTTQIGRIVYRDILRMSNEMCCYFSIVSKVLPQPIFMPKIK